MLPVRSAFSMPPTRCSSPLVPGTAHGRASVSASRSYGLNPFGSVRSRGSMRGSASTSGNFHGSVPVPMAPSDSKTTGVRYSMAMRDASMQASKQSAGERPAEGRADRGRDRGDLVFGLERGHAELTVLGELVQDVARWRDRIAAKEQPQAGLARGGNQAERERGGTHHVPVDAGLQARRRDLVRSVRGFRRLAVVVAGLEGAAVRLG